jgi:hypothetical protein
VLKAALRNHPADPVIRANAHTAAQALKTTAGEGALDLVLLNADHGVMLIADTIVQQPWVQAQCEHFQVIIVVSRDKHFITYICITGLLSDRMNGTGRYGYKN